MLCPTSMGNFRLRGSTTVWRTPSGMTPVLPLAGDEECVNVELIEVVANLVSVSELLYFSGAR